MIEKLRNFMRYLHDRGIAIPLIRNTDGNPSVSLTMMIISFVFCLAGLLQKLNSTDLDVDMSQALVLLTITSGLYFSRRVTEGGNSSEPVESKPAESEKSADAPEGKE